MKYVRLQVRLLLLTPSEDLRRRRCGEILNRAIAFQSDTVTLRGVTSSESDIIVFGHVTIASLISMVDTMFLRLSMQFCHSHDLTTLADSDRLW
jgi:hypothetical protein